MKKVIAFLSVLTLSIAFFVGLTPKATVAADELWTEDPTISENEIPMYIMDSIYSTFPQYYDNAAKADLKWDGAARMYPWNETRLQVKQMDADGNYTGKEYAMFFAGSLNGKDAGAGNNILIYKKNDAGQVALYRIDGGKLKAAGQAMDPSLSHMRKNTTGEDITFDAITVWEAAGSTAGGNLYNRMFVFDGKGRMVRGVAGDPAYVEAGAEGALPVVVAPEYCYVDGVVTKYVEGETVCDKVKVDKVDEDGNKVVNEETGEVEQVVTDKDAFLYQRYLFQWVSKEEFESADFAGVNEVPYLSEGWDAMKWDYATYEEESDGYVCIAFLSGEGGNFKLSAPQYAVYAATCAAAGKEEPKTDVCREMARKITVPADGWSYDFGYLDKGKTPLYEKFVDMFVSGYKYGRKVDAEGNGMAYQKTVNFSAKPLYTKDIVSDNTSFRVKEGQNVIEVMQGTTIYPAKNVVYTGLANYWGVENDVTSFQSNPGAIELYMKLNGTTVVQPPSGYTTFGAMVEDFVADFREYQIGNLGKVTVGEIDADGVLSYTVKGEDGSDVAKTLQLLVVPSKDWDDATVVAKWYTPLGWDLCSTSANTSAFVNQEKYWSKWSWMFEYLYNHATANQASIQVQGGAPGKNYIASPGFFRDALYGFMAQTPQRSISGTWANTCGDWSGDASTQWLDPRTNIDLWNEYSINTDTAAINTNYTITYKAVNADTGISSELTITYVVVDEYTPVLKVNKDACIVTPRKEGDKIVIDPIDPFTLCTAYDAKYNGTILGNDISANVHYTSDTLDFAKPTEGDHKVTARVYNGFKYVEKTFVVSIEDLTAPRAFASDLVLAYGSYFTPSMGLTFAYDDVDGNLLDNNFRGWCIDASKTPVNTSKPGSYKVTVEVSDKSGNVTPVTYNVKVLESVNLTDLEDSIDSLKGLAATESSVSDLADQLAELSEKIDALSAKVDANASASGSKCGSKSALIVEFLAAASLLGLVLRKKH